MPIQRILWTGTTNLDIHLLREQSTSDLCDDRLFFEEPSRQASASIYFDDHRANPDVTLINSESAHVSVGSV